MNNNINNSIINPQIRYLTEVLDDISKGEIRVPKFQRPYVWRQLDIISLFDSIYKGYPIGSLLFWETDESIESLPKIGPYTIPSAKKKDVILIIDGHQRLSTLYGVLKHSEEQTGSEYHDVWSLYFDLEREEFLFPSRHDNKDLLLPMNKVVSTLDFLNECQKIQNLFKDKAISLINRAQELAQAIVTYKLSITQIKGGYLSSVVEIFSRVNTKGLEMTPDQMFSALTYREGKETFKLDDRIDEILQKLVEFRFSEVERIFIFRAIIAASKKDIYNVKLEDLARDKKIDIPSIVNKSESSLIQSAEFLYKTLNVPGDRLLPYNLQLVFLSEFFNNCPNASPQKLVQLAKWFWFTSYSGWFAGASSTKVRKGLEEIRTFAKEADGLLPTISYSDYTAEFPDKFDFRFARVKTFVLFLLSLHPKPLEEDADFNPKVLLGEQGSKALHYILPDNNMSSNRMILGPVKFGYAKKILQDENSELTPSIIRSHAITEEALTAFRNEDYMQFLKLRHLELNRLEREFMLKNEVNIKLLELKRNPFQQIDQSQLDLFGV